MSKSTKPNAPKLNAAVKAKVATQTNDKRKHMALGFAGLASIGYAMGSAAAALYNAATEIA